MADNVLINPGFETGDFTGWTLTGLATGGGTNTATISASYADGSNYGCLFGLSGMYWVPTIGDHTETEQPLTLGLNFNSIKVSWEVYQSTGIGTIDRFTVELRTSEITWTPIYSFDFDQMVDPAVWTRPEITKSQILSAGVILANVDRIRFKMEKVS